MDNTTYKKEIMGLLPLPEEKRIEAVEKLLDMLQSKDNANQLIKVYGEAVMNGESNLTIK